MVLSFFRNFDLCYLVVAAIILVRPFDVMRRPVIRDIVFYLFALSMLIFVVCYDRQIYWWQPASKRSIYVLMLFFISYPILVFLLVYVIYAFTVISSALVRQRLRKDRQNRSRLLIKVMRHGSSPWKFFKNSLF